MKNRLLMAFLAVFSALFLMAAPAHAQTPIDWDPGSSTPSFDSGSMTWDPFDSAQAQPAKGGIIVTYPPSGFAYPIDLSTANIFLQASATASEVPCTLGPAPMTATPGSCYFSLSDGNRRIRIEYLGNLSDDFTFRGTDLLSANPVAFSINDFNSADTGVPLVPDPARDPARLLMVLDKSGSMRWSSHPTDMGCGTNTPVNDDPMIDPCGPSRWKVLNDSVEAALSVAEPYALAGHDRFAAALFNGNVSYTFPAMDAANKDTLLGPSNITTFLSAAELGGQTPGGSTSIGDGMEYFDDLVTGPDAGDYNQSILVFSDGEENTAQFIVMLEDALPPTIGISNTDDPGGAAGASEFAPGVRICPFAMRSSDPNNVDPTDQLAFIAEHRCDDLAYTVTDLLGQDNPALTQFFLQVLNNTLVGDKLEILKKASGQLFGDEGTSELFITGQDVQAFTTLIQWNETFNGLSELVLEKDGVTFPLLNTDTAIVQTGENHISATLRQPFCNDAGKCVDSAGKWKIYFRPFFQGAESFTYDLFVNADNASIASEFKAAQPIPGILQPIELKATLSEADNPLKGGHVKAVIRRAEAGLGNVLSLADIRPADQQSDLEPLSLTALKVEAMLEDPNYRPEILAALQANKVEEVVLTESSPGVYTGLYKDTFVDGVYFIDFFAEAKGPINGPFTRTFGQTYYVPMAPDPEITADSLRVGSLSNCSRKYVGGCFSVSITPMNKKEDSLGPSKEKLFSLPDFKGDILTPFADRKLNGTYTVDVGFPEGVSGLELIDIGGVKIPVDVPAKQSKKYEYSAQLMCGRKEGSSGDYDTTVTIHNLSSSKSSLSIDLVLASAFSTKNNSKTISIGDVRLGRNEALTIDCNLLKKEVFKGKFPNGFLNGVVVIASPSKLQVNTTYTTLPRFGWLGTNGIYMREVPERPFRFGDAPTLNRD